MHRQCTAVCFFLFLPVLCAAAETTSVYYLDDSGDINYELKNNSLVHVSFPLSCERNCKATFVYEGKASSSMYVRILELPQQKSNLAVSVENSGSLITLSETLVDPYTISVFEETYRIKEELSAKKLIVITVISSSLEGKFVVFTGSDDIVYDFWKLTIGFPILVQQARIFSETFFLPFYFAALCVLFFLSWPLQRRRRVQTILRTLAMLSLVAWLVDAFYAYFVVAEYSNVRRLSSFLLHIVGNGCFLIALMFSSNRTTIASVAILSLFVGGSGLWVCPSLLFLDMVLLERNTGREQQKHSSIICKNV